MDDQYAEARAAVDACCHIAQNAAEGLALQGKACPGCGYMIHSVLWSDPDYPAALYHDLSKYLGGEA